jgi:hypothetical protein
MITCVDSCRTRSITRQAATNGSNAGHHSDRRDDATTTLYYNDMETEAVEMREA